jgi:hypothetical protein
VPSCCRREGSSRPFGRRKVPCVKKPKPRNPADTRAMRCVLGSPAHGLGLGLDAEARPLTGSRGRCASRSRECGCPRSQARPRSPSLPPPRRW